MKKSYNILLLSILWCYLAQAQESLPVEQAVRQFENMGYMAFADKLNPHAADIESHKLAAMMGDSYRLNGQPEAAAFWYARALSKVEKPIYMLEYAKALQSAGHCHLAALWYKKYLNSSGEASAAWHGFNQDCEPIDNNIFQNVEIESLKGINSEHLDFSPIPVEGALIFTSSRAAHRPVVHNDKWTKEEFTDLFIARLREDGTYATPKPLFGNINKKYHDGVASFAPADDRMYFTRNNKNGKNSKDIVDLKIYSAVKDKGYWTDVSEFPFNGEDFGSCHPAVAIDGRTMVFASDRPGGFGGMDLYLTKMKAGQWSSPQNLGQQFNTPGNEIFPHIDRSGRLYFSTDGRAGMGGLDIFICESDIENDTWLPPQNIGIPLNSTKDDFGIYVYPDGKSGLLSSNRERGMGKDDIYSWKADATILANPAQQLEMVVIVEDAMTKKRLPGTDIKWAELSQANAVLLDEAAALTSPEGKIILNTHPNRKYVFNVSRAGYEPRHLSVSGEEIRNARDGYVIPLERHSSDRMPLTGNVLDGPAGNGISDAAVTISNTCGEAEEMLQTNRAGAFPLDAKCGCTYTVTTRKHGYTTTRKTFTADCTEDEVTVIMTPAEAPAAEEKYEVGQVIKLKNVYYDFNKATIRSDASKALDNIVQLMKKYPDMEIELGSHTDARGNDTYNMRLSQRRAQSAVDYIISRGISASRITAKGYGESMLVNDCFNGVQCSEEAHQENRRTEVRITKIGKADVDVIYEDR